jgi:hypothetical protein
MAVSRQQIVEVLRRVGLSDAAATALATLPELMDDKEAQRFCTENGVQSMGVLTDRMGGNP